MTRGRKKDMTLPPSRSLAQQREYRSRKAQYVLDLETRCQRAETENLRLRQELTEAKAALAASRNSDQSSHSVPTTLELLEASQQVMNDFQRAAESIRRFETAAKSLASENNSQPNSLLQPHEPTPYPSSSMPIMPNVESTTIQSFHPSPASRSIHTRELPSPTRAGLRSLSPSSDAPSGASSQEPPFCGGWIDCRTVVDSDGEEYCEPFAQDSQAYTGAYSESHVRGNCEYP